MNDHNFHALEDDLYSNDRSRTVVQYGPRLWPVVWRYQVIAETNVDLLSKASVAFTCQLFEKHS